MITGLASQSSTNVSGWQTGRNKRQMHVFDHVDFNKICKGISNYYQHIEKNIAGRSDFEERIERVLREEKVSFEDPSTVADTSLNSIIDAFAHIQKDGSFISRFEDSSLNRLLILFNRWINIDVRQEEIFSLPVQQEHEVINNTRLVRPEYRQIVELSDQTPGGSLYNQIEKNKMGPSA